MMDLDEVKNYLFNEYKLCSYRKSRFERNDNEVDSTYETGRCDALWEIMKFIHQVDSKKMEEIYDKYFDPYYRFDPGQNVEYPLYKGRRVELLEDVVYEPIEDAIINLGEDEDDLLAEGFKNKDGYLIIPAGTIMTYMGTGETPGSWPEFKLRMKYTDYDVDFAGSPFDIKLI